MRASIFFFVKGPVGTVINLKGIPNDRKTCGDKTFTEWRRKMDSIDMEIAF